MNTVYQTIIVGSGCAGYNAADCLWDLGHRDIALLTEGIGMGTSRNTGSDKQTYYKLSLAGKKGDSIQEMAETLFAGGSVHGDTAYAEAAGSLRSFYKLVQLGVPFPANSYGAYVGYKTDHDPRQRATSCGPLTSRLMTEALERAVTGKGISVLDGLQAIELLVREGRIQGLAAMDHTGEILVFTCSNIILATGGPAGIYRDSVYPESQTGALGLAARAGADLCNLQEWQYGLASVQPRWNLSGSYQQVLPRYVSIDEDGREQEFLLDQFSAPSELLDLIFLKGYQWPFDTRKLEGSSRIDLLVQEETAKGRRVCLDFTKNPAGLEQGFGVLGPEAYDYLNRSGVLFGTPIERLNKMNPDAAALYAAHGIDLAYNMLEIKLCAQHCNGGISVDINWESSIPGLYVTGEAAGTFGVYRPGGSALNATQVGSLRAAEHIAQKQKAPSADIAAYCPQVKGMPVEQSTALRREVQALMSLTCGNRREITAMKQTAVRLEAFLQDIQLAPGCSPAELPYYCKTVDIIHSARSVVSAMLFSAMHTGSRGAALIAGSLPGERDFDKLVMTTDTQSRFIPRRPLPNPEDWFETVWKAYKERRNL